MPSSMYNFSSKKDEDDKPKGFEKFFKKKDKEESQAEKSTTEDKNEEEAELSEEETSDKKEEKEKTDDRNAIQKFFLEPDNNPKPEGFVAAVLGLATAYYLYNYKKPMKEVVYMEFLNDYLL